MQQNWGHPDSPSAFQLFEWRFIGSVEALYGEEEAERWRHIFQPLKQEFDQVSADLADSWRRHNLLQQANDSIIFKYEEAAKKNDELGEAIADASAENLRLKLAHDKWKLTAEEAERKLEAERKVSDGLAKKLDGLSSTIQKLNKEHAKRLVQISELNGQIADTKTNIALATAAFDRYVKAVNANRRKKFLPPTADTPEEEAEAYRWLVDR